MTESVFKVQGDYHVPLLKLLAGLPNGQGQSAEVQSLFWKRYQDLIPQEHRLAHATGDDIWAKNVQWCRYDLVRMGLMDAPSRGAWRITQRGRDWLADNPQATSIRGYKGKANAGRLALRMDAPALGRRADVQSGITLEMLEETRKAMQPEDFQRVWGQLHDRLKAEERAKYVTQIRDRVLLDSVRQYLKRIQDFLLGQGNYVPRSEETCDWIHFCSALKLYREASALLQHVKVDDVNPWQYQRTQRISSIAKRTLQGGDEG